MIGLKRDGCGVAHMIGFCSVQQYSILVRSILGLWCVCLFAQLISAIDFQKAKFEEVG